jgi:hypothetical protein
MSDEKQLHVLDHALEPEAELYRLTIGYLEKVEVPLLDDDGEPVREGNKHANELEGEIPGDVVMTTVEVPVPVEYFVFSAGDAKWKGKGPDDIVREQKRVVRKALRDRELATAEPERLDMPGIGDPL